MHPQPPNPPADGAPIPVPGVPPFAVDVRAHGPGVLVAHVRGDLDYLVTPALRRHLLERLAAGFPLLVVDLTAVTLLSAAAIQVLLTVHELAREHGVEVRLVAATRAVLRPLQLTGVDAQLPLHVTVDEATRSA